MTKFAITGSTGNIGGRIARHLADSGLATRLIVRDANRAPKLPHTNIRSVEYRQDHKTFIDAPDDV